VPEPLDAATSTSEVAASSTIIVIKILAADFGPWKQAEDDPLKSREVKLRVSVESVLKGRLRQPAGQPIELTVEQRSTGGGRIMDYYGLWSHVRLEPGTQLLAFCHGESGDLPALLTEEQCSSLLEAAPVLEDTRAAVALEGRKPAPSQIVMVAADAAPRFGGVFARFVWESVKAEVMSSPAAAEPFLRIVENAETHPEARETYLAGYYEELGMLGSPPRAAEIRLARAMTRVLLLPAAGELRETIASVYLPNLLTLDGAKPKYSASEVLPPPEFNRGVVISTLRTAGLEEPPEALLNWLAQR
jgi:hypothetical protein